MVCLKKKQKKTVTKQTNRHTIQYIPSGKVTQMLQLAIKKKKRAKQTDKQVFYDTCSYLPMPESLPPLTISQHESSTDGGK